jgi:hypothetical protein
MAPVLFYAPTYFSPYYFAPLVPMQIGTSSGMFACDRNIYETILSMLTSTCEFACVVYGTPTDANYAGVDCLSLAILTPGQWVEFDDVDPIALVRQVTYTLTLIARDENSGRRFNELDRLSSVAQNCLDASGFNGVCVPALTKLRRGRYDPISKHPEQRLTLEGEFTYFLDSYRSH